MGKQKLEATEVIRRFVYGERLNALGKWLNGQPYFSNDDDANFQHTSKLMVKSLIWCLKMSKIQLKFLLLYTGMFGSILRNSKKIRIYKCCNFSVFSHWTWFVRCDYVKSGYAYSHAWQCGRVSDSHHFNRKSNWPQKRSQNFKRFIKAGKAAHYH